MRPAVNSNDNIFSLFIFLTHPVINAGEDSLEQRELGVDAEEEQHEEEHHGEQLRHRQRGERVRVGDEGKTLT